MRAVRRMEVDAEGETAKIKSPRVETKLCCCMIDEEGGDVADEAR